MRTYLPTTLIIMFAMIISACAGDGLGEAASAVESSGNGNADEPGTPAAIPEFPAAGIPRATELIIGILQLEGTDLAVDAEQAADLLSLWKAYRNLSNSETAAAIEVEAILNQIQGAMTTSQMEVIAAMDLTEGNMVAIIQELGVGPERFQGEEGSEGTQPGGGFPGGGRPEGGFPGGPAGGPGGRFGGAENLAPEQLETLQAERSQTEGLRDRFGALLVDALIDVLERKIN